MDTYCLHYKDRSGRSSIVTVSEFPFTIGRDPDNSLVIPEASVSRRHASLRSTEEGLFVFDHESRNKVFVNSAPAPIQKCQRVVSGDVLRIGSMHLRLELVRPQRVPIPERNHGAETVCFVSSRDTWDSMKSITAESLSGVTASHSRSAPAANAPFPAAAPVAAAPAVVPAEIGTPMWNAILTQIFSEPALERVYPRILDILEGTVAFDRCAILLFDGGRAEASRVEDVRIACQRVRGSFHSEFLISRRLLARVAESREALVVTADDARAEKNQSFISSGASTAIAVPLIVGGVVSGAIYLDRLSATTRLSSADVEVIGPLAGLVGLKLDRQRDQGLRRELELAASIQEALFPKTPPAVPGYAIDGFTSPCLEVGGDYYDFCPQDGGRIALVLGDVSGKGLPAAMYMTAVRANLLAHLESERDPGRLMGRLERHVLATFRSDHFLTLFIGSLDPGSGILEYSNAGHLFPIVLRQDGSVLEVEGADPALNLVSWGKFETRRHEVLPGEVLLLYTDGLMEAENAAGEPFGKERLVALLREVSTRSPSDMRRAILGAIDSHCGARGAGDDRTLILLKRDVQAAPPAPVSDGAPSESHGVGTAHPFAANHPLSESVEILRESIPSRLEEREPLIDRVLDRLAAAGVPCDPYFDRLFLDELIANAILHGNRSDPGKRVSVRVFWVGPCGEHDGRWGYEVADEGSGFDVDALLRRLSSQQDGGPQDATQSSGRGLALLLGSGADVKFFDGGRRIVVAHERQEGRRGQAGVLGLRG